jgi:hypothetical protein
LSSVGTLLELWPTAFLILRQELNVNYRPILLKNSKIFWTDFSAVVDYVRKPEVISMPELAGDFSRRNRRHTTIPLFVGENNSLTVLKLFGPEQKGSFSTE